MTTDTFRVQVSVVFMNLSYPPYIHGWVVRYVEAADREGVLLGPARTSPALAIQAFMDSRVGQFVHVASRARPTAWDIISQPDAEDMLPILPPNFTPGTELPIRIRGKKTFPSQAV